MSARAVTVICREAKRVQAIIGAELAEKSTEERQDWYNVVAGILFGDEVPRESLEHLFVHPIERGESAP